MPANGIPRYGLVLCGGNSSRMGQDKAFIIYHKQPQYAHVEQMLRGLCDKTFISCNPGQINRIGQGFKTIADHPLYLHAGPLTGLLSAMHQHPEASWLIVGCDYPYLQIDDLAAIAENCSPEVDAVCYRNPVTDIDEPLIAWYNQTCFSKANAAFHQSYHSLRSLLGHMHTVKILPRDALSLRSVDLPSDTI